MKRRVAAAFAAFTLCFAAGCDIAFPQSPAGGGGGTVPSGPEEVIGTVLPISFDNEEIVSADETEAGSLDRWQNEVFTATGNNDMPTKNAVIKSPFHTLEINGVPVPVYSARCPGGTHSFARIDVKEKENFRLDVVLTTNTAYKQCVVLPESRGVVPELSGTKITAALRAFGSFSFTFSEEEEGVTDPALAPLTIMVTPEEPLDVPDGYDVVEIEPGYHETEELVFTAEETCYVFKKGLHEISTVNVPSNSILYLEPGAYLKCTDRVLATGGQDGRSAIEMHRAETPKILGRGLLDMGECLGGDGKYRGPVHIANCIDPEVRGLTVVNANTWTVTFYNDDGALAEYILLLGYRTYSDGIMMSETVRGRGRYNFVRTGDDAIEYKATGWSGFAKGTGCVYEYNDVWTGKGRAYGVIYESNCDMQNMTFRNNTVGFAMSNWHETLSALECHLGTRADALWSDIRFSGIEIYYCNCPQVLETRVEQGGGNLADILFENISVKATREGTVLYTMDISAAGSIENVTLDNIDFCGRTIAAADAEDETVVRFKGECDRTQLTIV